MKRFDQLEHLVKVLGIERTLNELVCGMSDDQMEELYDWIVKCYDLEREVE